MLTAFLSTRLQWSKQSGFFSIPLHLYPASTSNPPLIAAPGGDKNTVWNFSGSPTGTMPTLAVGHYGPITCQVRCSLCARLIAAPACQGRGWSLACRPCRPWPMDRGRSAFSSVCQSCGKGAPPTVRICSPHPMPYMVGRADHVQHCPSMHPHSYGVCVLPNPLRRPGSQTAKAG